MRSDVEKSERVDEREGKRIREREREREREL